MRETRRMRGSVQQAVGWLLVAVVVLGGSGAAWAVPQVRTVLRDSFTEREPAFIELYFAKDPFFDGNELVVPLGLTEYGDTGGRHEVKAWAENADGKRLATGSATVTTEPGTEATAGIRLRIKGKKRTADLVGVSLPGHPHRLRIHLR